MKALIGPEVAGPNRKSDMASLVRLSTAPHSCKEISYMLLNEELARSRIRDLHEESKRVPSIRAVRAPRRSKRPPRWFSKNARRFHR